MDRGSIQLVPIVRFPWCNFFFPLHWEKERPESDGEHGLHGHPKYPAKKHKDPECLVCLKATLLLGEHLDEWLHDLPLLNEGYSSGYDLFD